MKATSEQQVLLAGKRQRRGELVALAEIGQSACWAGLRVGNGKSAGAMHQAPRRRHGIIEELLPAALLLPVARPCLVVTMTMMMIAIGQQQGGA